MGLLNKGEAVVFMTINPDQFDMRIHPVACVEGSKPVRDAIKRCLIVSGFRIIHNEKEYNWEAIGRRGWKASKADVKRMMKEEGYTAEDYGDENVIYKKRA